MKQLNLANKLTIFRIILIPFFAIAAYNGSQNLNNYWYWIAVIIFTIASITDALDGKIARKYNMITKLGQFLDPLADKLLTTVAFIFLVKERAISLIIFLILVIREFMVALIRYFIAGSVKKAIISADIWGKIKTVTMMLMIIIFYFGTAIFGKNNIILEITNDLSYICVTFSIISAISYIFFANKSNQTIEEKV